MPDLKDRRHAVILSGGGAYGAYEVGVLKALVTGKMPQTGYTPIDPEIYTGTSVGALNAAVMISQHGQGATASDAIEFLENSWLNLMAQSPEKCGNGAYRIRADPLRYLNPRCLANPAQSLAELTGDGTHLAQDFIRRSFNFFNAPGSLETRALEFVDLSTFISPEPFYQQVREVVSLEAIRGSNKALRIVAANWVTGEVKVFKNEDFTDEEGYQCILASAAIPGFFPPQYILGYPYVDGGVVMNTPLKCAIEAGADFLHTVYMDPDLSSIPLKVLQNTYNTMDRTVLIHNATVTNEDVDSARWINDGLDTIERVSKGEPLTNEDVRNFVRVAAQIEQRLRTDTPYRKLTIHRYHPSYDPGGGGIGILNFKLDRIERLIEQGFNDTVGHSCKDSRCLLPAEERV